LRECKHRSDLWKDFGFQRDDMTTDFRAAGLFGAVQFTYFAKNYPHEVMNAKAIDSEWFFLALVSIRLTHSIMVMF